MSLAALLYRSATNAVFFVLLLLLTACSVGKTGSPDGGGAPDGASTADWRIPVDGRPPDDASLPDEPDGSVDASLPLDAGRSVDASVLVDAGASVDASPGADGGPVTSLPRVAGVTIDSVWPHEPIVEALRRLSRPVIARIVYDEFMPATEYEEATVAISQVSSVMGELLDSWYVSLYSVDEYLRRTEEYLALLGPYVDLWEVGNEINGEWLCGQSACSCSRAEQSAVVQKMVGAFDRVKDAGEAAALTLYYNEDCWCDSSNEMFAWVEQHVPARMRSGLDYVWVSYYEDDCNGLVPDWDAVFSRLADLFPQAQLGIGECGTTRSAQKAEYIERYYSMTVSEPRFVGGYFWWYFLEDMVPYTKPLWSTLDGVLATWEP